MRRDLALVLLFVAALGTLFHLYHDRSAPGDRYSGQARAELVGGGHLLRFPGPSLHGFECRGKGNRVAESWRCFRRAQRAVIVEFLRRRIWPARAIDEA